MKLTDLQEQELVRAIDPVMRQRLDELARARAYDHVTAQKILGGTGQGRLAWAYWKERGFYLSRGWGPMA